MAAGSSCVVDTEFGPGDAMYIKTKAELPPETVWRALKDFSPERPALWPFIDPGIYQVHHVEENGAEATEGTRLGPGVKIWARERFEWDDTACEIRATVIESNAFKPGGTARFKVTPTDGGCYVEEWYARERIGLLGKVFTRLGPRIFPRMMNKGRAQTYAMLAQRGREQTAAA